MNDRLNKNGFTLVEILVAMSLIAAILAMVYGSYFATARSAQACETSIAVSRQGQKVLEQIARQIRCSYAGAVVDDANSVRFGSDPKRMMPQESISYFSGDQDAPGGKILRMVTTNARLEGKRPSEGLFEVTYRFDKSAGTLSLNQRTYPAIAQKSEQDDWQEIADNVESFELAFFDGENWLDSWEFEDKKKLPNAVRIEIGCRDENHRLYRYGTVAYISCQRDHVRTRSEASVSTSRL